MIAVASSTTSSRPSTATSFASATKTISATVTGLAVNCVNATLLVLGLAVLQLCWSMNPSNLLQETASTGIDKVMGILLINYDLGC
jgi:hypothetical protein